MKSIFLLVCCQGLAISAVCVHFTCPEGGSWQENFKHTARIGQGA
ncbi:hypothetical protein [Myroides pelagicus]|nr:hypothetical protein [Myroides pelagicus]